MAGDRGYTVLVSAKKKLLVFVSSTYVDMKLERQAAVEAILRAGHIPAGMELFAAGDETQLEVIRRWIDESDVFCLLLGGRYGSIEPKSQRSYIELEYDHAISAGKRCFAVVASDDAIASKVSETSLGVATEKDNPGKYKAFKDRVLETLGAYYTTKDQIQLRVFQALVDLQQRHAFVGWVPGTTEEELSEARASAKAAQSEVDRLSKTILELRGAAQTAGHADKDISCVAQRLAALEVDVTEYEEVDEEVFAVVSHRALSLLDWFRMYHGQLVLGLDLASKVSTWQAAVREYAFPSFVVERLTVIDGTIMRTTESGNALISFMAGRKWNVDDLAHKQQEERVCE